MSNRVVLIAAVPKGFPSSRNGEKEKRMQLPAASLVQPTPAMCAYDTLTMVWAAIDRVLLCLIALYLWLQYRKASRCRVMGEGKAQLPAASLAQPPPAMLAYDTRYAYDGMGGTWVT